MKQTTRTIASISTATALCLGTVALTAGPASATELAPASPAATSQADGSLITGPLIDGPLIDLGGILNSLRIGQFQ
ncbi:hypothetical protein [Leucobacter chromiiresistens]|uniref:Secreted protein n=1 Tax=Leucobacter chromiiresistens TaxID=1079994 RepID=A0A147EHJ6_9MICO|nr:hypothetical protein [Leucobacter chromiiresistens]KTR83933.1 hypothetical protein NS354_10140 [Leucobacter chromiiresistens]